MSAAALVAALRAPIDELRAAVGSGVSTDMSTEIVGTTLNTLSHIATVSQDAWASVVGLWTGTAAEHAGRFVSETGQLIQGLTGRATTLLSASQDAGDAIGAARRELDTIADEFTARAEPLAARVDEPGVSDELAVLARMAFEQALAVVERLMGVLDVHTAAVTTPAGYGAPSSWPTSASVASWSPEAQTADLGSGVAVTLPDGNIALAPNALAASAVQHALTQLGVPYDWGGTTPGVGLDCSGLTQWAYGEAGLGLPRLAQEQDVGAAVNASALLPGDLAVWDGHVAMIVGEGLMIEAGDPVQLSEIRTTNSGQGFQGFWRPTAS